MSRFGNLEFDGEEQSASQGTAARTDEGSVLAEAQRHFQNAEFEKSLRSFAKVLEFNPQNTAAWTGQVRALIELNEFREAALWADKSLEKFPNEPALLAAKAVALARAGDLEEAIALSDLSIEERGDTPYVWLARGDVLLARRESRADYCFDKALALARGDWVFAWLAARIRFYYKQFALAMKLLQQALETNATHFVLWLELGRCQSALGLAGAAERSFSQARQLNPDCAAVRTELRHAAGGGMTRKLSGLWRRLFSK